MISNEGFIRCFVALDLPESVQLHLEAGFRDCRSSITGAKWVNPNGIHLTLKFLGDVPLTKIPSISDALEEAFVGVRPIETRLSGVGAFPTLERARVLWVGLQDETRALEQLFLRTEKSLSTLGFPREKRAFKAHLTIARIKSGLPIKEMGEFLKKSTIMTGLSFVLDQGTFYQSVLKPQGAEYVSIRQLQLGSH